MKKITFLILLLLSFSQGNAQIADGSVAPDFTVTDINGNVHTLSTYLNAGKTVIMDVSATWCGPCWSYHNTHALEDIYNSYGVNGSNEVVVLFVEGDASTTLANLNGTGNTQGNWVAGTPYPIIDDASISSLYQIAYFPTVFRICPNGLVYEIGALSASGIKSNINTNCGTLTGAQNHIEMLDTEAGLCTSSASLSTKFKNYGVNPVTSAVINLKENGTVVGTKTYTGTATQFSTKTVVFDPITVNPTATYTVQVTNVNTGTNLNSNFSTADVDAVLAAQVPSNTIQVRVYTDNYPTEMTWRIKNTAGTIVASGGPYAGSANGGGADANTTKIHDVTLPSTSDCYKIELLDSYGDGWSLGSTPHGLEIFSNGVSIYNLPVGNFGTSLVKDNAISNSALGVDTFQVSNKYNIYPNPSKGILRINTVEDTVELSVIDITGKEVFSAKNIDSNSNIDLSHLQKGLYLAKVNGAKGLSVEKIILE